MPEINLADSQIFSEILYEKMQSIHAGIADLELYEFRYALENVLPADGWDSIRLDSTDQIEAYIHDRQFYKSIQLKPRRDGRLVLDEKILHLLRMLFVGLVTGDYPAAWICTHFYFDIRGFYFLHRTEYLTEKGLNHLEGKPYRCFVPKQKQFESAQSIGYKAFQAANIEVDQCFIESVQKLVAHHRTPILIAIAGQTAAGKTEIVARLQTAFDSQDQKVTTIEIDNFLTDRDYREEQGIDSLGKEALHYELFKQCLSELCSGKKIVTPRYNFVQATSSHDLQGKLKDGCAPVEIEPADIIFIEGNFPFLYPEVAALIGIKVVYLTDDAIRIKRKWKRDMDYRKKYEPMYFLNRYFREQFLMAEQAYIPQIELCDLFVDTTNAAIWAALPTTKILDS